MMRAVLSFTSFLWLFLSCVSVQAGIITLDINGFLRQTFAGNRTVLVPKFDSSFGVLNSMTIMLNPEISGTIEGTATGSPGAFNGWGAGFGGNLSLVGPGFSPVTVSAAFPDRSGLLTQPNLPVFEFYGPSVRPMSVSLTTGLSNYIGVGNTSLTLGWPTYTPTLFFSQSGRLDRTTRDLGMQAGSVTYNFTAVPEPSSLAFIGCSLVALVVWRRPISPKSAGTTGRQNVVSFIAPHSPR